MAQTPEGKVKKKVSDLLKATSGVYYYMPVPGGYGGTTLDYIGCHRGAFFGIETKAPGKKPTDRQKQIISAIERGGGETFVIDNAHDEALAELRTWLNRD
jgi:hypothetical protein